MKLLSKGEHSIVAKDVDGVRRHIGLIEVDEKGEVVSGRQLYQFGEKVKKENIFRTAMQIIRNFKSGKDK